MHNDAAVYLCELVCTFQPTTTLRSANNSMLEVKRTRVKPGDGSFAIADAPQETIYQSLLILVTLLPVSNVY